MIETKNKQDMVVSSNDEGIKKCLFKYLECTEIWSELSTSNILIRATSEVLGTALLVMILCMGCLEGWTGPPPLYQVALCVGLVIMFVVQIFGHVSGAHVNPAITVVALVYRVISLPMAGIYIASQFVGATFGYGLLLLVTPLEAYGNNTAAFCTTQLNPHVSVGQGVIVEIIITGILTLLTCSIWDGRNKHNTDAISIKFGFTVATIIMATGHFTGASMNPARSFAPALWNNFWKNHWVYWVGPLLGAAIFSLFYCLVFKKDAPAKKYIEEEPLREINDKSADLAA